MWERIEERLLLLELLTKGGARRRKSQESAFDWLSELPWTARTPRRDELDLVETSRQEVAGLLDRVWPQWRLEQVELLVLGAPPTPAGWRRLEDHRRARTVPVLPDRLNKHSASAEVGPHSKSTLTASRAEALGGAEVADDGVVRIRPALGMRAERAGRSVELDALVEVLGELGVSDRALRDGLCLRGPLDAVLLVENLGPWRDMPRPDGWLLAHVPGWNTATVRRFLSMLGEVPVFHFGDLDPNGVRIYRHLREHCRSLRWFVPELWRNHLDRALRREWPEGLSLRGAPQLVRELAAQGLWLEQEPLTFEPGLEEALGLALRGPALGS